MDETQLKNLIQNTENAQGLEMAEAIRLLQAGDTSTLTRYLDDAQKNIKDEITRSKSDMFQKVYGDLERASSTERAILYYKLRNADVDRLQGQLYDRMKGQSDSVLLDKELAQRQYQINQWTSDNKLDTLFVYQWTFLIISLAVLLFYLVQTGFLSAGIAWSVLIILIIIVVLITINRSQYTAYLRDQREWNRRRFPRYKELPQPPCPNVLDGAQASYNELKKFTQDSQAKAGKFISNIGNATNAARRELLG